MPSPARPLLKGNEVHIWRAYLNQAPSVVRSLLKTLTPDERRRAGKFHFLKDRDHFVVARGGLREVLSHYLPVQPYQISFSYNQYGKPMLSREMFGESLRFNVTHSHEIALYAITRESEVGLDIEFIRDDIASLEIAERFFAPSEILMLRRLPPGLQTPAFFNCWTRKEAFIKALGEGLSHPLDQFVVSLVPGYPARLIKTYCDPEEISRWSLVDITLDAGYVAALAVEGSAPILRYWQYSSGLECCFEKLSSG